MRSSSIVTSLETLYCVDKWRLFKRVSFLYSIDMSDQDLLARTTSILRNALTELEGTLSANSTNNNLGDPHGVSVGTSSIRERASDNFRLVHIIAHLSSVS